MAGVGLTGGCGKTSAGRRPLPTEALIGDARMAAQLCPSSQVDHHVPGQRREQRGPVFGVHMTDHNDAATRRVAGESKENLVDMD